MRVALDLHDDLVSGVLEAEVEAADAREERHCLHAASGGWGSAGAYAVSWFFFFVVEHWTTPGYSTPPSSGTHRDLRVGAGGADDGCDRHGGGSILVLGCIL
jgi:hypothetical protein